MTAVALGVATIIAQAGAATDSVRLRAISAGIDTATVGVNGGIVSAAGGIVTLELPPGILDRTAGVRLEIDDTSHLARLTPHTLPRVRVSIEGALKNSEAVLRWKVQGAAATAPAVRVVRHDRARGSFSRVSQVFEASTQELRIFLPASGPPASATSVEQADADALTPLDDEDPFAGTAEFVPIPALVLPDGIEVTWSFSPPPLLTAAKRAFSDDAYRAATRRVMSKWAHVLGLLGRSISFREVPASQTALVEVGFKGMGKGLGVMQSPSECSQLGNCAPSQIRRQVYLASGKEWGLLSGMPDYETVLLHEVGHALGLDHFFEAVCRADGPETSEDPRCGENIDVMSWRGGRGLEMSCRDLELVEAAYGALGVLSGRCAEAAQLVTGGLQRRMSAGAELGALGVQVRDRHGRSGPPVTLGMAILPRTSETAALDVIGQTRTPSGEFTLAGWRAPMMAGEYTLVVQVSYPLPSPLTYRFEVFSQALPPAVQWVSMLQPSGIPVDITNASGQAILRLRLEPSDYAVDSIAWLARRSQGSQTARLGAHRFTPPLGSPATRTDVSLLGDTRVICPGGLVDHWVEIWGHHQGDGEAFRSDAPFQFYINNYPSCTARDDLRVSSSSLSFSAIAGGVLPEAQSVGLTSSGGVLLHLSAAVTYPANVTTGWLEATLDAGRTPATLRLRPSRTNLPVGLHTATVRVISDGTIPEITVTYRVSAP